MRETKGAAAAGILLPVSSLRLSLSLCFCRSPLLTSATKYPRSLSIWKHVLRTRKAREAGSILQTEKASTQV